MANGNDVNADDGVTSENLYLLLVRLMRNYYYIRDNDNSISSIWQNNKT